MVVFGSLRRGALLINIRTRLLFYFSLLAFTMSTCTLLFLLLRILRVVISSSLHKSFSWIILKIIRLFLNAIISYFRFFKRNTFLWVCYVHSFSLLLLTIVFTTCRLYLVIISWAILVPFFIILFISSRLKIIMRRIIYFGLICRYKCLSICVLT